MVVGQRASVRQEQTEPDAGTFRRNRVGRTVRKRRPDITELNTAILVGACRDFANGFDWRFVLPAYHENPSQTSVTVSVTENDECLHEGGLYLSEYPALTELRQAERWVLRCSLPASRFVRMVLVVGLPDCSRSETNFV